MSNSVFIDNHLGATRANRWKMKEKNLGVPSPWKTVNSAIELMAVKRGDRRGIYLDLRDSEEVL